MAIPHEITSSSTGISLRDRSAPGLVSRILSLDDRGIPGFGYEERSRLAAWLLVRFPGSTEWTLSRSDAPWIPPKAVQAPVPQVSSPYLSIEEAARYVKASVKTLRRGLADGIIPAKRIGRRGAYRFLIADLDTYLAAARTNELTEDARALLSLSDEARRLVGLNRDLRS